MSKPIKVFKAGAVEVAIFENQTAKGVMRNAVLSKRYMTAEGEWKSTSSLGLNEIPKAKMALDKVYEYLLMGNGAVEEPEESF